MGILFNTELNYWSYFNKLEHIQLKQNSPVIYELVIGVGGIETRQFGEGLGRGRENYFLSYGQGSLPAIQGVGGICVVEIKTYHT